MHLGISSFLKWRNTLLFTFKTNSNLNTQHPTRAKAESLAPVPARGYSTASIPNETDPKSFPSTRFSRSLPAGLRSDPRTTSRRQRRRWRGRVDTKRPIPKVPVDGTSVGVSYDPGVIKLRSSGDSTSVAMQRGTCLKDDDCISGWGWELIKM